MLVQLEQLQTVEAHEIRLAEQSDRLVVRAEATLHLRRGDHAGFGVARRSHRSSSFGLLLLATIARGILGGGGGKASLDAIILHTKEREGGGADRT